MSPLADEPTPGAQTDIAAPAVFAEHLPVLLIEDDPVDAELLVTLLRRMPPPLPPVQQVTRMTDAVAALGRQHFQLVLLDLELPDSSGLASVRTAVAAARGMPVIVITGSHDDRTGRAVIQAGAQDFLVKGAIAVADLGRLIRHAQERQRSLTDLEQAKTAAERALAKLQRLEAMRDQLVHMLVHDLRSPLFGVRLTLEALQREAAPLAPSPLTEDIDRALGMTGQLTEMVSTILDVHRLEAEALPLRRVALDLHQLAEEAITALGATHRGSVVRNLLPSLPVWCDRALVRRVLANLLANAFRFSPAGEPITLAAKRGPHEIEISVEDHGPGVPPERRQRIFEKFGALTPDDAGYSTGLGLPFCKLVVELHGGRIGVDSAPGTGSRFWFTLPTAPPAVAPAAPAAPAAP